MESGNDDVDVLSTSQMNSDFTRTGSLKKQHVHWLDGSAVTNVNNFHSNHDQKFTSQKQTLSKGDIFNTTKLTESPSVHRHYSIAPTSSLSVSHFIPTNILPAGSAVGNIGTSQFLTPFEEFTSISLDQHIIV